MAEEVELKPSPEFEKAMNEATSSDEIKAIVRAEAERQGVENAPRTADVGVKETTAEETKEEKVEGQGYYEDIVIGGQSYKFEGDSPADVIRQIKAATTAHENATKPAAKEAKEEPKTGLTADEKVSLELDYRMGKISIDAFLEKTGALDAYLEKKGLKVDELKEVVQEKITNRANNAWQGAVEQFLQNSDWPGGAQNEKIIKLKMAEMNLSDPTPASLNKAYEAMKAEGLVFENKAVEDASVVKAAEPAKKKVAGSSMFGLGGGSVKPEASKSVTLPTITPDMDGKEIMRLYKEAAQAAGLHPDELLASRR